MKTSVFTRRYNPEDGHLKHENTIMDSEQVWILKEAVNADLKILSRNSFGVTEENQETPQAE
jgi:hypothetical protein